MIIINVKKGETIDRVLKRFKKKFEKVGTLRELRARMRYKKASVKRREEIIKAVYRNKMQLQAN